MELISKATKGNKRILYICGVPVVAMKEYHKYKHAYFYICRIYRIFGIPLYIRHIRYDPLIYGSLNGNFEMALSIGKFITESPQILEKVQNLIKNLDETSTKNVLQIIARLKTSYLSPSHRITELSRQELDEIFAIKREFYPNIIELTPEAFCYAGGGISYRLITLK